MIGIEFLCTPMSRLAAIKINDLVKRWKIGSGDVTDFELLDFVAKTKKPIILSTGMHDLKEITKATDYITEYNKNLTLMHCTSMYPCPDEKANLNTINFLKQLGFPVGYSDHTLSIDIPVYATMLGIAYLEKHFTIERWGKDANVSLGPTDLKLMIEKIRKAETIMGEFEKVVTKGERELRKDFVND